MRTALPRQIQNLQGALENLGETTLAAASMLGDSIRDPLLGVMVDYPTIDIGQRIGLTSALHVPVTRFLPGQMDNIVVYGRPMVSLNYEKLHRAPSLHVGLVLLHESVHVEQLIRQPVEKIDRVEHVDLLLARELEASHYHARSIQGLLKRKVVKVSDGNLLSTLRLELARSRMTVPGQPFEPTDMLKAVLQAMAVQDSTLFEL